MFSLLFSSGLDLPPVISGSSTIIEFALEEVWLEQAPSRWDELEDFEEVDEDEITSASLPTEMAESEDEFSLENEALPAPSTSSSSSLRSIFFTFISKLWFSLTSAELVIAAAIVDVVVVAVHEIRLKLHITKRQESLLLLLSVSCCCRRRRRCRGQHQLFS